MKNRTKAKITLAILLASSFTVGYFVGLTKNIRNECSTEQATYRTETHVIRHGETLWEIASENKRPGDDIRDYIRTLEHINGITADIKAGQVIEVMVYDDEG